MTYFPTLKIEQNKFEQNSNRSDIAFHYPF